MIRLGAPIFGTYRDPDSWVAAIRKEGWSAAYYPDISVKQSDLVRAYAAAAKQAGIVIAEVGVWNNPISPDTAERKTAVAACKEKLALAEELGAACCVNIGGSCNPRVWHGPHADNLTAETVERIVAVTREIIDAVKPKRTFYTLEAMPWIVPDSVDGYVEIVKAIDRKAFAVHLDPVNFVVNPRAYFDTTGLLKECFRKLGGQIKSCHAKDIRLREEPVSVMFDEVRPGQGGMDYDTFLRELAGLDREIPLMLEHLPDQGEYAKAGEFIRGRARALGIDLK